MTPVVILCLASVAVVLGQVGLAVYQWPVLPDPARLAGLFVRMFIGYILTLQVALCIGVFTVIVLLGDGPHFGLSTALVVAQVIMLGASGLVTFTAIRRA